MSDVCTFYYQSRIQQPSLEVLQFTTGSLVNKVEGPKTCVRGKTYGAHLSPGSRYSCPSDPGTLSPRSRYYHPPDPGTLSPGSRYSCPSDPGTLSPGSRYSCPSDPGTLSLGSRYSRPSDRVHYPSNPGITTAISAADRCDDRAQAAPGRGFARLPAGDLSLRSRYFAPPGRRALPCPLPCPGRGLPRPWPLPRRDLPGVQDEFRVVPDDPS